MYACAARAWGAHPAARTVPLSSSFIHCARIDPTCQSANTLSLCLSFRLLQFLEPSTAEKYANRVSQVALDFVNHLPVRNDGVVPDFDALSTNYSTEVFMSITLGKR